MDNLHIYHDPILGVIYIDAGLKQIKIALPTADYEEVLYVVQSDTLRAIVEQMTKGAK